MHRKVKKLVDENPELLDEWVFNDNQSIADPYMVAAYSTIRVWWKCSKCGYKWMSDVKQRFQGHGCPKCANESRSKSSTKRKSVSPTYNLRVMYPKLAEEWNIGKNQSDSPELLSPSTHKKVWWMCKNCGNEWQASVASRVNGAGCPYCSGRKIVTGVNDLATLHPELLEEWNYKKNEDINPHEIASNTHIHIWWKCRICGNEWEAAISDRARGNGCPFCNYSNRTSEQEQILYYYLQSVFPDAINSYRPDWIGNSSEIDIYIPSLKIGVEYDGCRWHRDIQKDIRKDAIVDRQGITLFRLREAGCPTLLSTSICIEVEISNSDKSYMLLAIKELIDLINSKYNLSVVVPDFDLKRDRTRILASYEGNKKGKSLAIMSPSIAAEWNYEKNNGLIPENMANQSNKKVWWQCRRCGYEWEATINNRIKRGCPACSNKVVWVGHNDIPTTYPEMLAIWNYDRNREIKPEMFTSGAEVKVWWKCNKCGYEWEAMIYRIKRSLDKNVKEISCPACVGKAIWKGHNDLQTLRPDLALEWDYSKNDGLLPAEITLGSTKSIWWKCNKCGHEWHTSPYNRSKNGSNCPACAIIRRSQKLTISVKCIETGQIFSSTAEAGAAVGRSSSAILFCLKDSKRTCGGFHWEKYV